MSGPEAGRGHGGAAVLTLEKVDADTTAAIISAATDIALIVDGKGVIRDAAFGDAEFATVSKPGTGWVGRPWIETVASDSREKVEQLLEDARDQTAIPWREINHRGVAGRELPVRYSAVRLDETGRVLALGRDLRSIASLQQQLVGAQQAMEREYARLRHAETRYRLLFQIASEAVLIVDAATHKIVEANPAAGALLSESANKLVGRELSRIFNPDGWPSVQTLLASVRVAGWAEDVRSDLAGDESEVLVSASLFRQDSGSLFLIRMSSTAGGAIGPQADAGVLEVLDKLPDAFVVIGEDRRILSVNSAFLDLVQLAAEPQVRRASLDQWLGRPGVDLNILLANVREHGSVRNFSTIVRGQYGTDEEVEVSGVAAVHGDEPCYGFVLRPVSSRSPFEGPSGLELPQSVEQLTGLVGRVPLKEIVRQTTDVIESLCIETALEVSGDNRASAAQMLGLSRQSLYAKLRRLGIGDLDDSGAGA